MQNTQSRSTIPYGQRTLSFTNPNQHINDRKIYLPDGDTQALSHTTLNMQVLKENKQANTRNTSLWKW